MIDSTQGIFGADSGHFHDPISFKGKKSRGQKNGQKRGGTKKRQTAQSGMDAAGQAQDMNAARPRSENGGGRQTQQNQDFDEDCEEDSFFFADVAALQGCLALTRQQAFAKFI